MAQSDGVVVGIDVAKDKGDACIRKLSLRQTFPSPEQGHRKLIAWLRKHKVTKAVMEASGGYERAWARVLRDTGIDVRIVDPKRVRAFALSAGRLQASPARPLRTSLPGCRSSDRSATRSHLPCWVSPPMMTIAAAGAASAISRAVAAGSGTPSTCLASAQPRSTTLF